MFLSILFSVRHYQLFFPVPFPCKISRFISTHNSSRRGYPFREHSQHLEEWECMALLKIAVTGKWTPPCAGRCRT